MKFNEYQQQAATTNIITDPTLQPICYALGLCGEAGEVAEIIKKNIRNAGGDFSRINADSLSKELGDVLWYISMLADTFGITLNDIAELNMKKLNDRKDRGVIMGVGENR